MNNTRNNIQKKFRDLTDAEYNTDIGWEKLKQYLPEKIPAKKVSYLNRFVAAASILTLAVLAGLLTFTKPANRKFTTRPISQIPYKTDALIQTGPSKGVAATAVTSRPLQNKQVTEKNKYFPKTEKKNDSYEIAVINPKAIPENMPPQKTPQINPPQLQQKNAPTPDLITKAPLPTISVEEANQLMATTADVSNENKRDVLRVRLRAPF